MNTTLDHSEKTPVKSYGGDVVAAFPVGNHQTFFLIADVAGSGPGASRIARQVAEIARNRAPLLEPLPLLAAAIQTRILSSLSERHFYVTAVIGLLNNRTGMLQYINAGHPPALILSPYSFRKLECGLNLPLGIGGDPFSVCDALLAPGETLLLYTDGFAERLASDGTFLEETGIAAAARAHLGRPSRPLAAAAAMIGRELQRHTPAGGRADDSSLLLIRRTLAGQVEQSALSHAFSTQSLKEPSTINLFRMGLLKYLGRAI